MDIEQQKNFEEFGFTFKFKDEVDNLYRDSLSVIHARLVLDNVSIRWNYKGVCVTHSSSYNLTPIAPEVTYPIFKKNEDGIYRYEENGFITTVLSEDIAVIGKTSRELSNTKDVPYDHERGLYHGQPIYMFPARGRRSSRLIKHFNIENIYTQGIEPIPLETLKTLPFIWEQYKAFIKEN